jgi:hypothetical protein
MADLTDEQAKMLENLKAQYLLTEDRIRLEERLGIELSNQNKSIAGYLQGQENIRKKALEHSRATKALIPLQDELNKLTDENGNLLVTLNDEQKENYKVLKKIVAESQKNLKLLEEEINIQKDRLSISKAFGNTLMDGAKSLLSQHFSYTEIWNYLQKIDKEIRMNNLLLGLSGEKAKAMREQLEGSINAVAYLGASLKDIVEFQQTIAAKTGRAYLFSKEENIMMAQLVKGTGLAGEEIGNLISSMMLMGTTVEAGKELIEDSMNSTAKLGLSTNNVLKKLNANVGKLNSYRFQDGIKGLEQMVKYSEQFQISMETSFAAAEKFRTLDGLLDTGANLRVLGGEFAKMDEFKLSFLARNKPEEFTKELAKLTKGMASFNKETGTFELSDIDFDRARAAAEATNTDFSNLVASARQVAQIDFAKKQILIGTDKEKEMIANLAKFKAGSNMGIIQIGSEFVKLTELTDKHLSTLRTEAQTLEERTIQSQNFNDTLTNLVNQLKTVFLPALTLINDMLTAFNKGLNFFRDEKTKELSTFGKILGGIAIGAVLISPKILSGLWGWLKATKLWQKTGGLLGGGTSPAATTTPGGGLNAAQMLASGKGAMYSSLGTAATILAIGAALYFAAKGASSLADSIAKLNSDQTTTLIATMSILGVTISATVVGAIFALGKISAAAAPELYLLGGAVALIGGGIGVAAAAIGYMINGLANLYSVIPNTINSIANLANVDVSNLSKVGKELTSMSIISLNSLIPLQNLKFVDKDIENMKQMTALLAQINSIDTSKLDALGKLFTSGTMKVQLDGNPTIRIDNRIDVDGTIFYKKVEKAVPIIIKQGFDPRGIDWANLK